MGRVVREQLRNLLRTGVFTTTRSWALLLSVLLLVGGGGGCSRTEPDRPNIIFFTLDTVRADRIGCYGGSMARTPHLDQIAENGLLYTQAISPASWTLPAMASIMTSVYPSRHGAYWVDRRMDGEIPTLAQSLQAAGYHTAGFHGHLLVSSLYGFDRGFDVFREIQVDLSDTAEVWANIHKGKRFEPTAEEINSEIADWIENEAIEPFFLWVHYFDPHMPYKPPAPLPQLGEGPWDRIALLGRPLQKYFQPKETMPEGMLDQLERLYDAEIHWTDRATGNLLEKLRARFPEEPLVVLTSDHGEEFKDHGHLGHTRTLYNELIRVPLILSGPGIPAGRNIGEPVQTIDIFPTLLDYLGLEPPRGIAGLPLPFTSGGRQNRMVFSETRNRFWPDSLGAEASGTQPLYFRSMQRGNWKLILSLLDDKRELFDMSGDPGERIEQAASNPDTALALLHAYHQATEPNGLLGDGGGEIENVELSEEERERLRTLGYIR